MEEEGGEGGMVAAMALVEEEEQEGGTHRKTAARTHALYAEPTGSQDDGLSLFHTRPNHATTTLPAGESSVHNKL